MSRKCCKCGGTDICTRFQTAGSATPRAYGAAPRKSTVYAEVLHSRVNFLKDCLDHHCRTCGYEWETETLDAKDRQ